MQYSFTTVRFLNHKEAWVGGSHATPCSMGGIFFSTNDESLTTLLLLLLLHCCLRANFQLCQTMPSRLRWST